MIPQESGYKLPYSQAFTSQDQTLQFKKIVFDLALFINFDFGLIYCGNLRFVVAVVVFWGEDKNKKEEAHYLEQSIILHC